jgi:hypothetical protein
MLAYVARQDGFPRERFAEKVAVVLGQQPATVRAWLSDWHVWGSDGPSLIPSDYGRPGPDQDGECGLTAFGLPLEWFREKGGE